MRCVPFFLIAALVACGESASESDHPATRCEESDEALWLAFSPTTAFDRLVLARLARDAPLTADRVINTVGGGQVRVAGGWVANCWGIPYSGLRCAISPATP